MAHSGCQSEAEGRVLSARVGWVCVCSCVVCVWGSIALTPGMVYVEI